MRFYPYNCGSNDGSNLPFGALFFRSTLPLKIFTSRAVNGWRLSVLPGPLNLPPPPGGYPLPLRSGLGGAALACCLPAFRPKIACQPCLAPLLWPSGSPPSLRTGRHTAHLSAPGCAFACAKAQSLADLHNKKKARFSASFLSLAPLSSALQPLRRTSFRKS